MSQVDEFGRAIPQGGSDGDAPPPPYGGAPHQQHHRMEHRGLSAPRGPSRYDSANNDRYNAGPAPHHHHHGGPPPPHWRSGRGGGGGPPPPRGRGGPPPPPLKDLPAAAAVAPAAIRAQSPTSSVASSSTLQQPLPHPSLRYVSDAMLCGFLWKEQEEKKKQEKDKDEKGEKDVDEDDDDAEEKDETKKEPVEAEAASGETSSTSTAKSYDDYRLEYAWTFLKHFFNQHLDDSWFRQLYSPALLVEGAQLERRRCHAEARSLKQDVLSSLNGFGLTVGSTPYNAAAPAGHLPSVKSRTLHVRNVPPHVTDEHIRQALLPFLTDLLVAQLQEQQLKANNASSGNKKRADKKINPSQQEVLEQTLFGLFSSTPYNTNTPPALTNTNNPRAPSSTTNTTPRGGSVFLHRSVFCILMTDKMLTSLWQLLSQRDITPEEPTPAAAAAAATGDVHVPRKQDIKEIAAAAAAASVLDLDIDCTDPYGRTEYDANGRGGPPPDGLAVPPRKAVVQLSKYDAAFSTLKLSVALSSPTRFASDQEAAQTIARALDVRHHVPVEDRLDSILEKCTNSKRNSDLLDVSLAYLRRVHLYSFYKTTKAESLGDYLSGRSAAAQVQLRDEPMEGENADDFKDDILGQRLNDSIRQALDVDCQKWIAAADYFVDETTDTAAREISELEEVATEDWLHKHLMDDDGRARCSFHFCHKLFKDESFLGKHLLKKHAAYNYAERAKCHDKYMMSTWENAPLRPGVPFLLVDCGKQFGKQEALMSGGSEPRAVDPEPALWERKQYQEKMLLERQELRSKRPDHALHGAPMEQQQQHRGPPAPSMNQPLPSARTGPKPTFVDVDDMKEETVQVSFDQVQLPPPTSTAAGKKKKKRKLL